MQKLSEGGLPTVLSQTFRAIIHSRMQVGLQKYLTQYKDRDVVLFEPAKDDAEIFFTNLFSYTTRKRVCEHAYQRTRQDLLKRRHALTPILAKYGITLNLDILRDTKRTLDQRLLKQRQRVSAQTQVKALTTDLSEVIQDLERFVAQSRGKTADSSAASTTV